jgi:hypothetical protein
VTAVVLLLAGCGDDEPQRAPDQAPGPAAAVERLREEPRPGPVERARCPADAVNCKSATGTIIYVERVDPDGDGDAHFVLASRESVTLPSISVIDVRVDLRPHPLPGPGDRVSAAGPVYTGSYGQRQIHADVVNVARAR